MENKTIDFQVITARYYRLVFGCSYKTARSWYQQDLEMLNRKRLTVAQFNFLYGTCEPVQNSTKIGKKRQ